MTYPIRLNGSAIVIGIASLTLCAVIVISEKQERFRGRYEQNDPFGLSIRDGQRRISLGLQGRPSQISAPSHVQIAELNAEYENRSLPLKTFCIGMEGVILAAYVGGPGEGMGGVAVFDSAGKQTGLYPLPFVPTALAVLRNGTIFAGGENIVARISAEGELMESTHAPNIADRKSMRNMAQSRREKRDKGKAKRLVKSISKFQGLIKRMEEVVEKKGIDPSNASESGSVRDPKIRKSLIRLAAYRKKLSKLEEQQRELASTLNPPNDSPPSVGGFGYIPSVTANNKDLFVTCRNVEGGYNVWRMSHEFSDAALIIKGIRGCCGQMDVQCRGNRIVVAENTSFKVSLYDRNGRSLGSFGKKDRTCRDGFGSCCNPMNTYPMSDGTILTAESSIGHIKRFSPQGRVVSYIGKAKITAGCKNCAVGYSPSSDQYYMLHQGARQICVLGNRSKYPDVVANDSKQAAQLRSQVEKHLYGTWRIGGRHKTPAGANASDIISSLPFKSIEFLSNGTLRFTDKKRGRPVVGEFGWTPLGLESLDEAPFSQRLDFMVTQDDSEITRVDIKYGPSGEGELMVNGNSVFSIKRIK